MYVEVNEEKLKHFIQSALVDRCYRCPLRNDKNNCKHYTAKTKEEIIYPCDKYILEWLQDINVIKALEDGAHIVNDEIMYPPTEHIKGGLFREE